MQRARSIAITVAGLAAALAACSPALDWREVRPAGSGAALLLPCRPQALTRTVALAGRQVRLALHACSAAGQTWSLAFADVDDPAAVGPALEALGRAAAANIGAGVGSGLPLAVAGATPNDASRRVALVGRLPDGTAVQEQVAVFTRGTRVFQATAIGPHLPDDGVDTFFGSVRLGP